MPQRAATLHLVHANTGKRIDVDLFDRQGHVRVEALTQLRGFMACHHTGNDHPVHWRLATIIQALAHHWPGRKIIVYSGYRHPSVSKNVARSNHTRGRAVDLRVEGVANRQVFEALRASFADIGVGYYPNGRFVHVDVRDSAAIWIDYAAHGQAPCYSRDPAADLRSGTADHLEPAAARARGCRKSGSKTQSITEERAAAATPREERSVSPATSPATSASSKDRGPIAAGEEEHGA